MIKLCAKLLVVTSILVSLSAVAASGEPEVSLSQANIDEHDMASVERGAKFFATNCLVCHSMKHLKYDKLSQKAGITYDKMPLKQQDWWFGAVPPDLSLSARVRGADWLYTYLHSFYKDDSKKLGSNNLMMPGNSMPNPFLGMQGTQVLTVDLNDLHSRGGVFVQKPHYFAVLRLEKQGSMSPEEFHQAVRDVVNYLVYASDPYKVERIQLGYWVLAFLLILVVLSYLLKKEYWKDVT